MLQLFVSFAQVWKVILKPQTQLELKESLRKGDFSTEDIAILKAWITYVEEKGPYSLENDFKWDDHSLWGKWSGCRSSCISNSGRIIYKIIDDQVIVMVLRVTNKHDYR